MHSDPLSDLQQQYQQAEGEFQALASSGPFTEAAQKLCAAARVHASPSVPGVQHACERAFRASRGVPTLTDIMAFFGFGGEKESGDCPDAQEVAAALRQFREAKKPVLQAARRLVQARLNLERFKSGAAAGDVDLDRLAEDELLKLPQLSGLEAHVREVH